MPHPVHRVGLCLSWEVRGVKEDMEAREVCSSFTSFTSLSSMASITLPSDEKARTNVT